MSRMVDPNSSAGYTQLSARVPEELKDEFKRAADQQDETMTEAIVRMMADYTNIDASGEDVHTPADDDLADALDALEKGADEWGRVETDTGKSLIAQQLGIPARAVRRSVLRPLQRGGWIEPRWGEIVVCRVRARRRIERARAANTQVEEN